MDKQYSAGGGSLPARVCVVAIVTALALVMTLTVAAGGTSTISRPAAPAPMQVAGTYGGSFFFPVVEPNSLDPADPDTEWAIVSQVFEGLTKWDDDHEPLPAIASCWESSDAVLWLFHIRPGARFHNGRQITAEDVVYSWERVAAEGNGWYDSSVAPLLNSATAVNSGTLEVVLNQPSARFPMLLALPFMSVVPLETVGTIHTDPVGSGPFQFASWTPGDSIVLEDFDDYYAGRPYLDSITYPFYASEEEMYDDFVQGGLDFSPVPDDNLDEISGDPNAIYPGGHRLYYYGMKMDVPPFDDVRVRQACRLGVQAEFVEPEWSTITAEGPIPPGLEGYDPPVPAYEYNPTLAVDLLAQAGWIDTNSDGVLDDGAGTDLAIEMWHPTNDADAVIAAAVADDLRDIGGTGLGAAVVVNDTDWTTYRDHLDQYPMYRLGWHPDYPDPLSFLEPLFRSGSSQNHARYGNPQVDAWLDEAAATLDLTARQEVYRQIETEVQEDAPFLNLFYFGTAQSYTGAFIKGEDVLGLVIPSWGLEAIQMEKVQLVQHDHDVMVQEILFPKESALAGEPVTPVVKLRNAGRHDEFDVQVRCRILQESTEVYDDTVIIQSWVKNSWGTGGWGSGYFRMTSLPAGDYTIECSTLLPGDENSANDEKTRDFTVTDDAFYDAFIRDHKYDEGDVCTEQFWGSPDIWVRRQPDGIARHQDPILGQANYVYVRVRNVGSAAITDGTVEAYYHDSSAGIRCGNWVLLGDSEPMFFRYDDFTVWTTSWVPTIEGHTCLFARFSSPDDPVSTECDVACDNNLAQRNVEVVSLEEASAGKRTAADAGQASVVFEVSNIYDVPAPVDLIVERGSYPATGALELEFSRDLFSRWLDSGGLVEGGIVIPDTTRISATHAVSTTIAGLPLGVRETQQARMVLSGQPGAEFELHVSERIHGRVIGGVTYHTPLPWWVHLPLVLKE